MLAEAIPALDSVDVQALTEVLSDWTGEPPDSAGAGALGRLWLALLDKCSRSGDWSSRGFGITFACQHGGDMISRRIVLAMASLTSVVLVAACVGDEPNGASPASGPDAAGPDGENTDRDSSVADTGSDTGSADAEAGPPCDVTKPWKPPQLIPNVNSASDDAVPRLSWDERTIYFQRSNPELEVVSAQRTDLTASFGMPTAIAGAINLAGEQNYYPMLAADGLTLFFTSSRAGGGGGAADLWISTRTTPATTFGDPAPLSGVNSNVDDETPFVRADGLELLFARGGAGFDDLYRATGSATSGFGSVVPVTELNTASDERLPVLSADGKTIFFASNRTDGGAKGGYDIWTASRPSPQSPFVDIRNVSELNTSSNEVPGWVSPDGCRLYLNSNSQVNNDLFMAERPK